MPIFLKISSRVSMKIALWTVKIDYYHFLKTQKIQDKQYLNLLFQDCRYKDDLKILRITQLQAETHPMKFKIRELEVWEKSISSWMTLNNTTFLLKCHINLHILRKQLRSHIGFKPWTKKLTPLRRTRHTTWWKHLFFLTIVPNDLHIDDPKPWTCGTPML